MRLLAAAVLLLFAIPPTFAADWPAFRGDVRAEQRGRAAGAGYAREWAADKNIVWKFALPDNGNSSPVVSRGKVFVTCASDGGKERHLYCLDRAGGQELWKRSVTWAAPEPTHNTNPACAASPATDGERVVVWHGSAGVFCYDFEGELLWKRELGLVEHIWGFGSSPIIFQNMAFLNFGPGENTRLIALDLRDGKTVWELEEPGGSSGIAAADGAKANWIGSWTTPQIARIGDRDQLICCFPTRIVACDPFDGKVIWFCKGLENLPRGDLVYTDPLIGPEFGAAFGGFNGPCIGFRVGGEGDVTETNRLWRVTQRNPQRIGSGVLIGNHVYFANASTSLMQCINVQTGEVLWAERGPGADHWGSMVLADGLIYVTDQRGATHVIRPNPEKFELVGTNPLGENSNSTPAFSDGDIFLRTFRAVYCIRDAASKAE